MGTSSTWRFALVTVALLLDSTLADIMVQPGYGKAGNGQKSSGNSQSMMNQPMVQQPQQQQQHSDAIVQPGYDKSGSGQKSSGNSQSMMVQQPQQQQQNLGSQNPVLQFLQHQHALQRNYIQQKHQEQHQQLLGLQQQELKHAAMESSQGSSPGNENVGNIWGLPGVGGLHTGNVFSLGPLGLNGLTLAGLGGLGGLRGYGHRHPLLLATQQNQQPQTAESTQPKFSVGQSEARTRREIRDSGDFKGYRHGQSRPQQDGGANPTVESKSDAAPQNIKSNKSSGDIVGDVNREEDNNDNVGSPRVILDPLNLMAKAESFIDDLETHRLPNPMDVLDKSSVDEHEARPRREIRDSGDSKRYRQKQSRSQQDGSSNPTVKSKSDAAPENTKSGKSSGDIVGDANQEEDNADTVGSPGGILDPLNLMDKAESFIDDLRTGHLPNPMGMLHHEGGRGGGLLPGFPNWLHAANPMANQPILGQPQQYMQYPTQDQYTMMNQQQSQSQQPSGPMVGYPRNNMFIPRPPVYGTYGPYGGSYGAYGSPYQMYFQPYSPMGPWARHSNLMQGSPMIGAANPPAQDSVGKMSSGNPNDYQQQMTGVKNPMNQITGDKAQPGTAENVGAPINTMNGGPVVGSSNPTVGGPNPAQFQQFPRATNYPGTYYQMMPAQNQMATYYQQGMGTNPMIGSPGPDKTSAATPQNPPIVGGPNRMGGQMNQFYDTDLQSSDGQFGFNDFNGNFQKHRRPGFDLDDIFDGGYGHGGYGHGGINSGNYDRIYESTNFHNGRPGGYGGSNPYHTHSHQQSYII